MKQITVNFESRSSAYTIFIGAGALQQIAKLCDLEGYSSIFVVTDESLQSLLAQLTAALPGQPASIVLPPGEPAKHIETVQHIWSAMHQAGCDRKSLVINLGGGVIGDLGGFAASTYMRGVDFLNVPTTLLAQLDASVGGKTGFNFDGIKNLIGTFSQPVGVVIDPEVLAGLPERDLVAGFGEMIKHGLIADRTHAEQATAKRPKEFSQDELTALIARSCEIKAAISGADETESGRRKLLNFGHTVGHAVEALSHTSDVPLLHGEAVSIGMVVEADLSVRNGLLPAADAVWITHALQKAELPTAVPAGMPLDALLAKMRSDKKNQAGRVNFTLLRGIGDAVYDQQVEQSVIEAALSADMEKQP